MGIVYFPRTVSTDKIVFKNNIVDRTKLLSMSDLGLKFH